MKNTISRREAREYVMSSAFQIDALKNWDKFDVADFISEEGLAGQKQYIKTLLDILKTHLCDIDNIINTVSDGWTTGRMAKMDLAILRTAAAEIMYIEDVPKAVAINEAVNIAKKYGSEQSPAFINAILGKIDG